MPTILAGIEHNTKIEVIPGLYPWSNFEPKYGSPLNNYFDKLFAFDGLYFAHPVKLSILSQIDKEKYCKLVIQVTIF